MGETDSETGGEIDERECVYNYNENYEGYLYQCEGTVDYEIEFDIDSFPYNPDTENCDEMQALIPDGQLCTESHEFGTESDEQPRVVACCGEYDSGSEDPYFEACTVDLAQQTCRMLQNRLQHHLSWNHFVGFETQTQNLIDYLGWNIGDCTAELVNNDTDNDPEHLNSHYTIPNDNTYWPVFLDFTISVDIGEIDGFTSIGTPCHGIDESDDNVFPKPQASIGGSSYGTSLSSSMTVTVDGPNILGGQVTGSEAMEYGTACSSPWCSAATFEINAAGEYAIQRIDLFTSSDVTLTNGSASYDLADVRIMLADAALGYITSRPGQPDLHTIDAGDAVFWLIGTDPDDPTSTEYVHAVNSTDIDATYNSGTGVWNVDAFDIEYVDFNDDDWVVSVPSSSWDD